MAFDEHSNHPIDAAATFFFKILWDIDKDAFEVKLSQLTVYFILLVFFGEGVLRKMEILLLSFYLFFFYILAFSEIRDCWSFDSS